MRISGKQKAPWFRCRGCRSVWGGDDAWHCDKCHRTFGVKVDWHRIEGQCVPPERMGWEPDDEGIYVETKKVRRK